MKIKMRKNVFSIKQEKIENSIMKLRRFVMADEKQDKRENRNVTINQDSPEILTNAIYTPAFLREQIGKLMRVEFLIGTNNLVDRIGILEDVGASYILLRSLESDTITYCDIYSIKFVTISNRRINNFMNNGYGGYNYY